MQSAPEEQAYQQYEATAAIAAQLTEQLASLEEQLAVASENLQQISAQFEQMEAEVQASAAHYDPAELQSILNEGAAAVDEYYQQAAQLQAMHQEASQQLAASHEELASLESYLAASQQQAEQAIDPDELSYEDLSSLEDQIINNNSELDDL